MEIRKLERAAALQILEFLHQKDGSDKKVNITELYKSVKGASETVSAAVKFLAEMGLVQDVNLKTFPPQRVVSLTPAGGNVACQVAELEKSLRSATQTQ